MLPILVNNKNEIFEILSTVTKFFECNHEEGNTRINFHALQQKTDVAVYSKDTDVLVLMIFAYALNKINEKYVMKIERKCINITKIVEYLSELTLQQSFLKFMQLMGVTQLFFYMVLGKLKFLKMSKWKRKTQVSKGKWCFVSKSLFKLLVTPEKKKTV